MEDRAQNFNLLQVGHLCHFAIANDAMRSAGATSEEQYDPGHPCKSLQLYFLLEGRETVHKLEEFAEFSHP